MIGALDVVLLLWLVLVAGAAILGCLGALGPLRRVIRERTRPIGELGPGGGEVVGHLRVTEPVRTVDGALAVAARLQVAYDYKNGGKQYQDPWALDVVTAAEHAELTDGTATCILDLDHLLLFGNVVREAWSPEECKARLPEVWADLAARQSVVTEIRITQTYVPADPNADVFVSGEVVLDESVEPGADYRSTRQRHRLQGSDVRPLLVAAWPERDVRRVIARPALRLGAVALVTVALLVAFGLGHLLIARALG